VIVDVPAIGAPASTLTLSGDAFLVGDIRGSCGGNGNERVIEFVAPQTGTLVARTLQEDDFDVDVDTVLYLREECDADDDLTCSDDGNPDFDRDPEGLYDSLVVAAVSEGTTYFLVVDSFSSFTPTPDERVRLELLLEAP
jgi:hypothetical protein